MVIEAMHDESGHYCRENTYRRVADRYFLERMYRDYYQSWRTCEPCQERETGGQEEELYSTYINRTSEKIGVDVMAMPPHKGFNYLVHARSDLEVPGPYFIMPSVSPCRDVDYILEEDGDSGHGLSDSNLVR